MIDDGFAGYCGIRPLLLDGRAEVELAWHVNKTYWNQGFATEAAFASMQLGFDRFALSRLVAIIHPDNRPSRRVARKLGMVEERTLVHDGETVVICHRQVNDNAGGHRARPLPRESDPARSGRRPGPQLLP